MDAIILGDSLSLQLGVFFRFFVVVLVNAFADGVHLVWHRLSELMAILGLPS